MEENQIKEIFQQFFNGLPNPVFCYPVQYFQYKNYLCEVARAKREENVNWNEAWRKVEKNPWHVFDAAFIDDGYWVTVLKIISKDLDVERTNLSDHIDSLDELDIFINDKLN